MQFIFIAQEASDIILIGIGDLDKEVPEDAELSPCSSLPASTAFMDAGPHVCRCQPGASGRYVYVYMEWPIQVLVINMVKVFGTEYTGM